MSEITCREAERDELASVLAVQRDAFARVAVELAIAPADLPPLNESCADLTRMLDRGTRFFVAVEGERVVGAVRGTVSGRCVDVGRLVVASSHVRRRVGTRLMELLEASYPDAERFRLFTGADATAPLELYRKLGYRTTLTDATGPVELVWLEKLS